MGCHLKPETIKSVNAELESRNAISNLIKITMYESFDEKLKGDIGPKSSDFVGLFMGLLGWKRDLFLPDLLGVM